MTNLPIKPLVWQQGAALIFSLILLLVATLVGVTAMQSTTLEEKMAGNLRDKNIAFQATEAALRAGEGIIAQNFMNQVICMDPPNNGPPPQVPALDQPWSVNPCDLNPLAPTMWVWTMDENNGGFPGNPRLDPVPDSTAFWWNEDARDADWWNGAASNSGALNSPLDLLANQPRYVLERYVYAPADPRASWLNRATPADGVVIRNENNFRREKRYHRVTARGVGGTNNSAAMLQSSSYQIYYVAN